MPASWASVSSGEIGPRRALLHLVSQSVSRSASFSLGYTGIALKLLAGLAGLAASRAICTLGVCIAWHRLAPIGQQSANRRWESRGDVIGPLSARAADCGLAGIAALLLEHDKTT